LQYFLLFFVQVVLSACSPYFQKLLLENPCKHPVIILPHEVSFLDLQFVIEFVYRGEVDVGQDELHSLLRTAEQLQIKGLCDVAAREMNHHRRRRPNVKFSSFKRKMLDEPYFSNDGGDDFDDEDDLDEHDDDMQDEDEEDIQPKNYSRKQPLVDLNANSTQQKSHEPPPPIKALEPPPKVL
jgi:BTB/POZ domain